MNTTDKHHHWESFVQIDNSRIVYIRKSFVYLYNPSKVFSRSSRMTRDNSINIWLGDMLLLFCEAHLF